MGDSLRASKPPRFVTSHRVQLSLLPPSGTENEYRPKCGDALWLGSKGRYGSLWINVWQVKVCDPLLTRCQSERFRDEFLMIKRYINRHFNLPTI